MHGSPLVLGGIAVACPPAPSAPIVLSIGRWVADSRHAALRRLLTLRAEFLTAMR